MTRLRPEATRDCLNKNFVPVMMQLAVDPVPNIRFNVSQTIEMYYKDMTPGSKIKCEGAVKTMCTDADFDCSYFAKRCLDKIKQYD